MDGDLEARTDVEVAGTVTGEEGLMETTPTIEQTPSVEEQQTAADVPKASEDNDDDVVLVEEPPALSQGRVQTASSSDSHTPAETLTLAKDCTEPATTATAASMTPSPPSSAAAVSAVSTTSKSQSEPIVIDDEEDSGAASSSLLPPQAEGMLSSTEPDSEIKIASVTTLGADSSAVTMTTSTGTPLCAQEDINLMITNVTSLKGEGVVAVAGLENSEEAENRLQISSAFSLNPEAQQNQGAASRPSPTFNPGRVNSGSQPVQNGETGTHQRSDSWISQSASFPRNQKQPGVDSPSPAAPLPKQPCQSSSGSQQPQRTMKVTCANCKKPLKKGQTAYQRKGSSHLFCSTSCLSAFSHKPTPKKSCTMCKKDITNMKGGTIVAQVDSSESFQEFCSTGCLAAYENKQKPQKNQLQTKCTVCGKLTEIRHEVSFKNVTHKICSDACFNRYRMANGLVMNCCEQCGNYLPSRATANYFLLIDGQQKRFCCQNCIRDYKQTHGKMVQCIGCKVMCRSFDATQCIGSNGAMESYCSTACMTKSKFATSAQNTEPACHFCKRNALPQYQANLPEGKVLSFCSSQCVTKFQNATIQTSTNGQPPASASENIQLKCNYCRGSFSLKPEILEWEDKVYQFCSKACCEDYKKLHCIVTFCEFCQEEKTLHETVKFSGVKRPFCSEGCKLLFKQDFARRLGLKCVTCNHCTQMCRKSVTKQIDGVSRDFCSETCAKKFHEWYYKAARCDCCKVQGNLMESVQWRTEMKHFCDQQCLLRFYCQQNEPNMATQRGPENTAFGLGGPNQASKMFTQGPVSYAGGGILKDVKNKAVLCKPLTMTKATYCKPHMQSKPLQTDEVDREGSEKEYIPVPIPVPVYVPVPMNLYTQATPTPVAIPLPVPVPVFLPTTLQNADQIVKAINELKTKVPSDPLEADLAAMAELIAGDEDEKPDCEIKCEKSCEEVKTECVKHENVSSSSEEEEEEDKYEPDLDLEKDLPLTSEPILVERLDADMLCSLPPVLSEEKEKTPRTRTRRRGQKRRAAEEESSSSSSPAVESPTADCSFSLSSRYGLNAWKRWATSAASQSSESKEKESQIEVCLKGSLQSLSPEELNKSLSRFVREMRRPSGECYAPDSILYLCLSIQKHLQDKGRTDDLFGDPQYDMFGEELNKLLKDWQPTVLPDGSRWGRVEEQYLWSSGQLGEQTPSILLRSLLYLNTKYFGLRTIEQHLRLSFGNIYGPNSSKPHSHETTVCIRIPSISQEQHEQSGSKRRRKDNCDSNFEVDGGSGAAAHCPVKKHECRLYELYLSKCPESVRQRTDLFYVTPEVSASSDSPLWFSSTPLEKSTLARLLTRVLLVRDIYKENQLEEEGV
ncbi:zinc finger MYM-type protein 2-like [Myxocyprinus asiaticus]|uniref:zinc finger MYM-type protein 2-like n=1 Tax=Myxocyprinus asiaticus TaxID=70543 RepID=UPI002222EB01|nr:zinc finger MYM-type protein 2-like [Myxocyprinus asiaticus]XP_051565425.1 zinc finger MYM-type protein 2-like [Myxocyprinus asiaticus]XP_051565426.1 zinc finger MYM-type protein 2-like [Myxocyprinus asiaticus]XP_051565427.1 zinc finger MYM-type protein 2-like [Myxocyprinus asiaticus]XP_051565428.1 zinc finger MYM-type protein 2-like [Myxocyprinus asiaticus]